MAWAAISGSFAQQQLLAARLMTFIADERNLHAALEHVASQGGQAVGSDGLRAADLSSPEGWKWVRQLRNKLRDGVFRPGELLKRRIPKRPGSSQRRTIYLQTLADRVVARGVAQIITPLLNATADPFSFCRSGRGAQVAVLEAQRLATEERRNVWIVEDLTAAFDQVPRDRLGDILRAELDNPEVVDLVLSLVATPARRGILQGCALSSLCLNVYLDRALHGPWREADEQTPLLRYMDDLLIAARSPAEAEQLYRRLKKLASSAGFHLKLGRAQAIRDLGRDAARWLGYTLRQQHGEFSIRAQLSSPRDDQEAEANHRQLIEQFARLHAHGDSWRRAEPVAAGIVAYLAPTLPYSDPQQVCRHIVSAAAEAGCDLIVGPSGLQRQWEAAHARFCQLAARLRSDWEINARSIPSEAELAGCDDDPAARPFEETWSQ